MNARPMYAGILWFILVFIFSRIACDATPGDSCVHGGIGAFFGFIYATVVLIGANALYYRRTKKRMKEFEDE